MELWRVRAREPRHFLLVAANRPRVFTKPTKTMSLPLIAPAVQETISSVLGMLETAGGFFGPAGKYIVALLIFIIGKWIVGKIRKLVEMGLGKTGLDNKLSKYLGGKNAGIEATLGLIIYAVLMIFVIIAALERIGLTNVTEPLQGMLSSIMGFIPRIIGAGIVLYIGLFLSRIVKQLLQGVLDAAQVDERLDTPISATLANIVSMLIVLLFIPAALGILEIAAIQEPVQNIVNQIMGAITPIFLATILVGIGFIIARIARNLVESFLGGVGANDWPAKIGISAPTEGSKSVSSVLGLVTMISLMVLFFSSAIDALNITILEDAATGLKDGYFNILLAIIIFGVGFLAANFAHKNLVENNAGLAKIAKIAILVMTSVIALNRTGLAPDLTGLPYEFAIYALALAFGIGGAIAIGLGGRGWVESKLEKFK